MKEEKVRIKVRLTEEEKEKLERNRSAADDFDQEALRKDGRLHRLARLSELQAGGGHTAARPRDRRKAGKGDVGRPL